MFQLSQASPPSLPREPLLLLLEKGGGGGEEEEGLTRMDYTPPQPQEEEKGEKFSLLPAHFSSLVLLDYFMVRSPLMTLLKVLLNCWFDAA